MKLSITVNQERIVKMGLEIDLIDAALFDYCNSYFLASKAVKTFIEEKSYTLIDPARIITDMPLLGIATPKSVNNHIDKLIDAGLLERCPINKSLKATYVCPGERYDEYIGFEEATPVKKVAPVATAPKKKPYEFSGLEIPHKTERFIKLLDDISGAKEWKNKGEVAWKMTFKRLAAYPEPVASTALAISIDRGYRGVFPESVKREDIARYLKEVVPAPTNTPASGNKLFVNVEDLM